MKPREERGRSKGKGKGKKGGKNPLPPLSVTLPVFSFGAFLLPLFIPVPTRAEDKKSD
jgi:hypothetical protein